MISRDLDGSCSIACSDGPHPRARLDQPRRAGSARRAKLSAAFAGNPKLCISKCDMNQNHQGIKSVRNVIIYTFLGVIITAMFVTFGVLFALRIHGSTFERQFDEESEMEWTFTPFQKLNFSIHDILIVDCESNSPHEHRIHINSLQHLATTS